MIKQGRSNKTKQKGKQSFASFHRNWVKNCSLGRDKSTNRVCTCPEVRVLAEVLKPVVLAGKRIRVRIASSNQFDRLGTAIGDGFGESGIRTSTSDQRSAISMQ